MAVKISPRICIWSILCSWLLLTTICLGTVVILTLVYDHALQSFFGENLTRLAQTSFIILSGWMLITFGAAIRSAKANRRSMSMIFFLFALLGFAGELLIMIALALHRQDVFGLSLIEDATRRLILQYNTSDLARKFLDAIHFRFECCGVDEWHREWQQVSPYPPRTDEYHSEPWVPYSCCRGILQINPTCGYARIRAPVTRYQVVMLSEYRLETLIPEPWFSNIQNEPCPARLFEWLEEIPVYALMLGLATSVSRIMVTVHAVFSYTRKRRKVKSKR